MELATISRELYDSEAQMKLARLEAAGFHPFIANEASALWPGTVIATSGVLVQVPEPEAADAREFLRSATE